MWEWTRKKIDIKFERKAEKLGWGKKGLTGRKYTCVFLSLAQKYLGIFSLGRIYQSEKNDIENQLGMA